MLQASCSATDLLASPAQLPASSPDQLLVYGIPRQEHQVQHPPVPIFLPLLAPSVAVIVLKLQQPLRLANRFPSWK